MHKHEKSVCKDIMSLKAVNIPIWSKKNLPLFIWAAVKYMEYILE